MARRYRYVTLAKIEHLDGTVDFVLLPGKQRRRTAYFKPFIVGTLIPVKIYKLPSELTLKEIEMYLTTSEGKKILDELEAIKGRDGRE